MYNNHTIDILSISVYSEHSGEREREKEREHARETARGSEGEEREKEREKEREREREREREPVPMRCQKVGLQAAAKYRRTCKRSNVPM